MGIKTSFGKALRAVRIKKGRTQESFSLISSRTYLSSLERGLKSPTLEKVDDISNEMNLHPLTLLILSYQDKEGSKSTDSILNKVKKELECFTD